MSDTPTLLEAVANLIKVKGRHHSEKAYQRLVAAYNAECLRAPVAAPTAPDELTNAGACPPLLDNEPC